MAGVFKKLSANDIKITPFEAHKQYNTTDLASIGASTASINWSGQNKSEFTTGSKKYYQIDKLYYRNYIRERAHRLELNDATYTTQERRLYQSASVVSLSQKTFGSEVQPESFELSGSQGITQFNFKDDGFGNLFDENKGKDNFPNEDYRILYIGPTQAFKRADLTINYETGNQYVNDPFPNGYTRTVYDDSYFLNEVEFKNVNFVTSSNSGFYSVKTTFSSSTTKTTSLGDGAYLGGLSASGDMTIVYGDYIDDDINVLDSYRGFDGSFANSSTFLIQNSGSVNQKFKLTFNPPIKNVSNLSGRIFYRYSDEITISVLGQEFNTTNASTNWVSAFPSLYFTASNNTYPSIDEIEFTLGDLTDGAYHRFAEIDLNFSQSIITVDEPVSSIVIPHQPEFNFETDDDFTINFYYDLNLTDHTNSTVDGDYFILTKEGTKSVPILPSEGTQHTPLSRSGSSQIGTAPIGTQFPYRIYYKGNYPNNNTASLFFERSDGEATQFVSASFFTSGSTDTKKFVSCRSSNGILYLQINDTDRISTLQNSPTLNKTVSNKANITLYNKPKPDGSYSNFIGYKGGQISQLMMWNQLLSNNEQTNISESIVGTPNVGNIFYDNGFAVITHPTYMDVFDGGELNTLKYKNTHLITENEYQCTMTEDEFESTTNTSIRKIPFSDSEDIADFATGSHFKPYVTSVGLYDDDGNLLVVGKLGQPIKASSETDTTFVIRFDT